MSKGLWFKIITVILSIFLTVVSLEILVRIYDSFSPVQTGDKSMYKYDNTIGWELEDGVYTQSHQDFVAQYSVVNGTRVTTPSGIDSNTVINFYGDSFGFGTGMADEHTIESFFALLNPDYRVVNYSVAGYGPLQYWMKYNATKSKDLNIFLIFTGNDYKDIQRSKIEWGPYKPMLIPDAGSYQIEKPKSDFRLILSSSDNKHFKFKLFNFVKNLLKRIPIIVEIRSKFISPDKEYVDESLKRFDHLFNDIDKDSTLFLILPSISIVSGISIKDNEGYFREILQQYLISNNLNYVDLLSSGDLNKNDYWKHEGHNNVEGNKKIAKMLDDYLKARIQN